MTIVHVAEAFGGGVIDFIYLLVKYLPQHNHILIYSAREDDIKVRFPNNVTFIPWQSVNREISIFDDKRATFELKKILKDLHYDVLHLHSSKAGFLGRFVHLLLGNRKKTTVIFSPNGASFERKDISKLTKVAFQFLERIANLFGGHLIGVSKSEAIKFEEIGIKGYYINNGITIQQNLSRANDSSEPLKVITVGRITAQKCPKLFDDIASLFRNEDDTKFIWIGDGELRSELKSKNIEITGWKSKSEVLKLMESGHIYLSTSLWEGLPFSVLDAMNFKYPLLLKNCTGNIDLVRDGENGFIFESADEAAMHIKKFLEDRKSITKMGVASYDILSKNFDAEMMAQKYEWAYSDQFNRLDKV